MRELGELSTTEVLFITIEREKHRAREDLPTILDLVHSLVKLAKLSPRMTADTKQLVENIKDELTDLGKKND
jgi:hypothetical protein